MFCSYEAVFSKNLRHINTLLPTLSKTLYISVVKFPCLYFGAHQETFVLIRCHLQNGVHLMHSLQDQKGGTRTVPDLGWAVSRTASRMRKLV
jgi:hypothetical protein